MPRTMTIYPSSMVLDAWQDSRVSISLSDIAAEGGAYWDFSDPTDYRLQVVDLTVPASVLGSLKPEQVVAVQGVARLYQPSSTDLRYLWFGVYANPNGAARMWPSTNGWEYKTVRVEFSSTRKTLTDASGYAILLLQLARDYYDPGYDNANTRYLDRFYIVVEYELAPDVPTVSAPTGTVWTLSPVFRGSYSQPDGLQIAGVEIEVQRASDGATVWNTTVTSGLSGTSWSVLYGGPALQSGTQYRWRARTACQGAGRVWSPWSAWQTFTPVQNTPPTASPLSPVGGAAIGTLTPTLTWSYSDPNGHAQAAYQVQVRRQSDGALMWDSGIVASVSQSAVYGGTGLENATVYEWRVRVHDGWDWGSYSAWEALQPLLVPDPPVLTSPSGVVDTLTPLIAGQYQQGNAGSEAAFQYQLRSGGVTIYDSGEIAGAIATGQVYGTDNPGDSPSAPPALQWATPYEVRARSKDSAGQWSAWSAWVAFQTQSPPLTPTGLQPADGARTTDTTPLLQWTHNDPEGDPQTAAEIELQVDATGAAVPGYPAVLEQAEGTHEVTAVLTAEPATTYRWRVRTKATPGAGWGAWSDWCRFTVTTTLAIAILAPADGGTVTAPGPTVQWAIAGGSGVQQTWRVRVFEGADLLADTGIQTGTAQSWTIPGLLLRTGRTYRVRVDVTDTAGYAATAEHAFDTAWTPPPTITGLSAVPIGSQEAG